MAELAKDAFARGPVGFTRMDKEKTSEHIISELRQRVSLLEAARDRAEQAAAETRRYLTQLIDSTPDAVISTDKEGNVVLFNEGAQTLSGYPAEDIVGRRVALLCGSELIANDVTREIRKRGGTLSGFESNLRAKDGTSIPVLISASVVLDEKGHEVGTIRFATDLRERKGAEETFQKARDDLEERVEERTKELRMARERFQYLLTVTPGIIYTNKGSGDFACTFVSDNVDPIMGFSAWEMLEDPGFWYSRLHPEDAPRVAKEVRPLLDQGGGTLEYRFRHRDGHYVWIQDTFRVLHDAQGRPSEVVGAWADISYHKQAQEALGERMAIAKDLQTLVAASPSVIYTTTQMSGGYACRFVSENLKSIMAYAPWEMRDDPTFWVKHLHPDDAPRVFAEVEKLIAQGGGTIEYRFRHRKGHFIWVQDTFKIIYDDEGKPKEIVGSWADISGRKQVEFELQQLARQVALRNKFIRETFGRYLTDEVVTNLLESPTGLEIGGEKCKVTMLMADLRGFTSLSERLDPERVVSMLNCYLTTMISIIKQYHGTIDEFIGDAIFVLFGAPVWQEDDAERAVACAVAMQLAMASINEHNRQHDLPEVEIGIGVHTGQVVVGNIGSSERTKYGVVGRHVNLTSRIQSYTVGGQILLSEATRKEVGPILKIGKQIEVRAKGIEHPLTVFEVLGIGRPYKLLLPQSPEMVVALAQPIPLTYEVMDAYHLGGEILKGSLTKLSPKGGEVRLENPVPALSNLKMHLFDEKGSEIPGSLYGKVTGVVPKSSTDFSIRFTSVSPEVELCCGACLRQALPPKPARLQERSANEVVVRCQAMFAP